MEDGVLWSQTGTDIVAREIAPGSPGERAGIQAGDLLLAIDGKPLASTDDVVAALHAATRGSVLTYSVLRMQGSPQLVNIAVEQSPVRRARPVLRARGRRHLLAAGRRGRPPPSSGSPGHAAFLLAEHRVLRHAGVLVQRPARSPRLGLLLGRHHVAAAAAAAVRPLRARVPRAPRQLGAERCRPAAAAARSTCPAALLGGAEVAAVLRGASQGAVLSTRRRARRARRAASTSAVSLVGGLAIMIRALRRGCSVTARRQLRWIVWGTALGAVPFVARLRPAVHARASRRSSAFEFTAVLLGLVPLAFASAIIRYRLMDVEVIIKRGARVSPRRLPRSRRSTRSCSGSRAGSSCTARISATRSSRCSRRSSSCCCRAR